MKKISDIDRIIPIEYNRLVIYFKNGTSIETDEVTFLDDDTIECGYIYRNFNK